MAEIKNRFTNAPWDVINSTFRHEIYFTESDNMLTGYSKKVGCSENKNLEYLLASIAVRLIAHGYLEKSYAILFYQRTHGLNRLEEKQVLCLYNMSFKTHNQMINNPHVHNVLDRVYTAIKSGKRITQEEFAPKKGFKSTDAVHFDFKKKFATKQDLQNYCSELVHKYGYDRGRAEAYFYKVIEIGNVQNS